MTKLWHRAEFWIVASGAVIAVILWHYRFRFPFDDTFISFRYAEHLASGNGLVWNIGGPHTEGFTNFLFVILLSVARFFTNDLLASAQTFGLASTIVTGILIYRAAFTLRDRATGVLAVSLYWTAPLTWFNALSGMETSLFVMLCALAILLIAREKYYSAFSVTFLALLTRPEAAMLAAISLLCIIIFSNRRRKVVTAFLFAFVLPLSIYFIWKYIYFGSILPNSFYIKVLGSGHKVFPGLQYVRLFVTSSTILIVLSLFIRQRINSALLVASLWAVFLIAFYIFVLPIEGLYDRFLWPAYVMLCVTGSIGLRDLLYRLNIGPYRWFALTAVAANISIMMLSPRTRQSFAAHEDVWDANMDQVVQELKALPHFDSIRIAYGDAGYVVYESGIYHIDLFGLNDTRIAHARNAEEREAIVRSEHPDIMLLPIRLQGDGRANFVEDSYGLAQSDEYEPAATIKAFPYTLAMLLSRSSPWYLDCKNAINLRLQDTSSSLRAAPQINY